MSNLEIISHYEKSWGKDWSYVSFPVSPKAPLPKEFVILEFPPNPSRKMWTYATCGMSSGALKNRIELHIFSDVERKDVSEILAACAYYHIAENNLGLGHTVNFGRPWANGSICDHGLISLPYLDGPSLELLKDASDAEIYFFWLIPISVSEVEFKKQNGLELLEQLFESHNFNYLNPLRVSLC